MVFMLSLEGKAISCGQDTGICRQVNGVLSCLCCALVHVDLDSKEAYAVRGVAWQGHLHP